MACFLIPVAEAIVTTAITKKLELNYTNKYGLNNNDINNNLNRQPFFKKLKWLSNLLWGGSTLLAFEHVWHGEITPWFPFLTAMNTSEDTQIMLHEMSTVGVSMALLVTAVWCGMVAVSTAMERNRQHDTSNSEVI